MCVSAAGSVHLKKANNEEVKQAVLWTSAWFFCLQTDVTAGMKETTLTLFNQESLILRSEKLGKKINWTSLFHVSSLR